eukprot:366344-Pleurochrysis_carterae.AAC.1
MSAAYTRGNALTVASERYLIDIVPPEQARPCTVQDTYNYTILTQYLHDTYTILTRYLHGPYMNLARYSRDTFAILTLVCGSSLTPSAGIWAVNGTA